MRFRRTEPAILSQKCFHTSPAQIGRYDTIIRHLSPEFKEELKADRINLSTAYELAGLPEEDQRAAFEEYQRAGEISIRPRGSGSRRRPRPPPAAGRTAAGGTGRNRAVC